MHNYLMTSDVCHPYVAFLVNRQTMRQIEHVLAMFLNDLENAPYFIICHNAL